jgi:hypothetical protein
MNLIIVSIILFALIILLSLMRQTLVFELSGASLLVFGNIKPGIVLYSILVLPGTIIHELSHWLVAEILQVRTGEITILPELKGESGSERLGSVATEKSDPFRGFLIGIAPFITGIGILLVFGQLIATGWIEHWIWWQILLLAYGIMVVGNSMLISREDRRTWPVMIILIMIVIGIMYVVRIQLSANVNLWIVNTFSRINLVLGVTAGFNLVMIGAGHGIRRIIEHISHKRITTKKGRGI